MMHVQCKSILNMAEQRDQIFGWKLLGKPSLEEQVEALEDKLEDKRNSASNNKPRGENGWMEKAISLMMQIFRKDYHKAWELTQKFIYRNRLAFWLLRSNL